MIKKIFLLLLVLIAALVVVIIMRPDSFAISRSTTIAAPPETVFGNVNDLHKWEAWSPWIKKDSTMKLTYNGPAAGKDSSQAWTSKDMGEGKMTITESKAAELVRIKLEFFKPFAATNDVDFTFKPEGAGTVVNWTMSGKNNFIGKAMSLFMDMEKMVGPDFEQGLASLKAVSEAVPKP